MIDIRQVDDLLRPGYLPFESGYADLGDGRKVVAALTRMPGCRTKMIDWWFSWLGGTDQYKLWHPTDHLFSDWEDRVGGKYIGGAHLSELALSVLCEDFAAHGQEAIEHMRSERPAEYVRVIAMLLPRQLQVQERTEFDELFDELENMSTEELRAFINDALKDERLADMHPHVSAFQEVGGISSIDQDRQTAQARDNLAQEI
jgi:hypothetical protein